MEVVDLVRSGALLLAFLAVQFGIQSKKDRGATRWLKIETVSTTVFGLGFLLFPSNVLGYMVKGKLDPIHLLLTRIFGVFLLSTGCVTYYYSTSLVNKTQRHLTQAITLLLVVVSMLMIQVKSQKDGSQKFNNQHLTFGILGATLWFIGHFLELFRVRDIGGASSSGFCLRTHADIHAAIDMACCFAAAFTYIAYPSYPFSFMGGKMDIIHAHMYRVLGVMILGQALGYLVALISGIPEDRHAQIIGRLAVFVLMTPIVLFNQWWYGLINQQQFTLLFCMGLVPSLLNIAAGYYSGRKEKVA
jgi:hypothetical protein